MKPDEPLNATHYELLARQIERFAFKGPVTIPSEDVPKVITGLRIAAASLARESKSQ